MEKEIQVYNKGYRVDLEGNVISNKNKILKIILNSDNYYRFSFRDLNGISNYCKVHRLQAYQKFKGKIFEKDMVVRHLNNISTDNSYNNISIGTQKENLNDIPQIKRLEKAKYASSFIKKYDHELIKEKHVLLGNSYKKNMEYFNISSKGTLNWILNK